MAQSDSGIYQIRNKVNGKVYIGSSVRVEQRISTHKRHLLLNKHSNQKLQLAYNKYGVDNFEYSILEYVEKELLLVVEQSYLDGLDFSSNYNICPVAGNTLGYKHNEETITKMCNKSPETRQKLRDAQLGRKYSDDIKAKVSAAGKGKLRSEETKAKMRKPKSDSHRDNISKGQLGMKHTPERIENIRQSRTLTYKKRKLMKKLDALHQGLIELYAIFNW